MNRNCETFGLHIRNVIRSGPDHGGSNILRNVGCVLCINATDLPKTLRYIWSPWVSRVLL